MRLIRVSALLAALAWLPTAAQAYVMGVPNPPLGQPETSDGVQITLPDQAPQNAMTEQQCIDSGEDCPKGYDWYLQTDYKIGYDLKIDVRYLDAAGETVAEADATTWRDGNVGDYGTVKYASPTIAGFTLSESWREDDQYDVALRYAGEFGAIRVAAGVGYLDDAVIGDYQSDPNRAYNAASNSFTGTPDGIAPGDATPQTWQVDGGYKFTRGLTLDLKYDASGWYGRSQGITEDVDTGVYVAPTIQRPKFEVGLDHKFNDWDPYKSGYFVPTETFQIPADAGGGSLGTFVPGTPTDTIGGLEVKARYQLNNDFTLSGNYRYYDANTGETQHLVGNDPSTYADADGFRMGGPIWKDKLWFFAGAPCRQELAGTNKTRNKTHIRASAPSAEDFIRDPDGPRQFWNARYDGAAPVVLDAGSGPGAISAALTEFLNQAYLWFAPSDTAILLGKDSAAGQGGPAIEVDPEIENADDQCNGSKTVIKGPQGPQGPAIATGSQGPATTTSQPKQPCNCDKEQSDYDKADRAVKAAEQALKDAEKKHQEARANYTKIDQQLTAALSMSSRRPHDDLPTDKKSLEPMNAQAVKDADAAYAAKKAAEKALEEALITRGDAKKALDVCKAKCPTSGAGTGGTSAPAGPSGPATTTGDKDKPCDCGAEQKAYDDAKKSEDAAEKELRDKFQAEKETDKNASEAYQAFQDNGGRNPEALAPYRKDLEAANAAANAARQAATKASEDYDKARVTTIRAKRALDECKQKCGK